MRVPTHWVCDEYQATDRNGRVVTRRAYGWSDVSDDDARRVAQQRAKRAVDYEIVGHSLETNEYGYGIDPAREELIDTLEIEDQPEPLAVVTRNRYGVLVLNTDVLLFADIDTPKSTEGIFSRLFGKKKALSPQQLILQTLQTWHAERRQHTFRIYQTFAGFRLMFTEGPHQSHTPATIALLRSLNSDPLYVRLCERQRCFRARLTPKPWRCGMRQPGIRFPYASDAEEQKQRAWEDQYIRTTAGYATCRLIGTLGNAPIHPTLLPLVELHDRYTLNESKPLA